MTKLFISIYRYFHKHQWQMWLSMVALFAVTGFFASQIHLEEDLNKLMPSSKNPDGTTKMAFADLRIKDKTFLLFEAKKGADTDTLTAVCDEFVDSLMARDNAKDSTLRVIECQLYNKRDNKENSIHTEEIKPVAPIDGVTGFYAFILIYSNYTL